MKRKNRKNSFQIHWILFGTFLQLNFAYAGKNTGSSIGDISIWFALFGLAAIGIFSLYLSSEKIKTLTRKFSDLKAMQTEIEARQNILLGVIGERLETSTHGIRRHREVLEGQSGETIDWELIRREMTRFRRDEYLLNDVMQDLQDFSAIRSGKLTLAAVPFAFSEMLKRLSQHVDPHYFLKRNELIYRFDPQESVRLTGDARRIEQVLGVVLVELGQGIYDSTVILSITPERPHGSVRFDILVLQAGEEMQAFEEMFGGTLDLDAAQHSGRKLKSYIAYELIRLMGGTITPVLNHEAGIHYRITLPLRSEGARSFSAVSDVPLLIVAHNEATALSVGDMLQGRMEPMLIDQHVTGANDVPDLAFYETVVITYAALQAGWDDRLRAMQREYPLRVIVLKNGFERTLPIPKDLSVVQTLRIPVLPEKLAAAIGRDIEDVMTCTVAV